MPYLCMRHDFRAPAFGPATVAEIYSAALEQYGGPTSRASTCWCCRSTTASTTAGCPRRSRWPASCSAAPRAAPVMVSAAILPLHDPVRIAEQIAVLDNAAPGRLLGRGRRGLPRRGVRDGRRSSTRRGAGSSRSTSACCSSAWTGEPFEWRGPHDHGHAEAGDPTAPDAPRRRRRARRGTARGAPAPADDADEHRPGRARRVRGGVGAGRLHSGFVMEPAGPTFVHVADDPEQAWAEIGAVRALRGADLRVVPDARPALDAGGQRRDGRRSPASPQFVVGTPAEVRARLEQVPADGSITFSPLAGGLPPELAWAEPRAVRGRGAAPPEVAVARIAPSRG